LSFLKRKNKTPREIAKEISEGKQEPQHIGKYTAEMIDQEIFSLGNTKPMFRDSKWKKRAETVREAIDKKLSRNQDSIICQFQLQALERIQNER